MKRINSTLLRNININYEEDKKNIKYDEYYFNGLPVPQNIKIENLNSTGGKIYWDIDNINIIYKYNDKNELQYLIELRKEGKYFKRIFKSIYAANNYTINNLENNTNYEIRICSLWIFKHCSEWSKIFKFKTPDFKDSIIFKESNKEND